MDQNLYFKLAAATKFLNSEYNLLMKYQRLDGAVETLEREYAAKKEQEKEDIKSTRIWGIIPFVVGIIWAAIFPTVVESSGLDMSSLTVGEYLFLGGFILAILAMIIFGFKKILSANMRKKQLESNFAKLWQEKYLPQYDDMQNGMKKIKTEVQNMHKEFGEIIAFLPEKYQDLQACSYLLMALKDGRADTLKEAYNLYEEQLHRWKMESAAYQAAEIQRYTAMAVDELNARQAETNVHLESIESMQYFQYLQGLSK